MLRIVATAHRMMPAHEVDAMAAIARQTSTGSACVGNVAGTAGLAATRAAGACCTGGEGDGRRMALDPDGTNGFRQIGKLLRYGLRPA